MRSRYTDANYFRANLLTADLPEVEAGGRFFATRFFRARFTGSNFWQYPLAVGVAGGRFFGPQYFGAGFWATRHWSNLAVSLPCVPDLSGLTFPMRQVARQSGALWRKRETRVGFSSNPIWVKIQDCIPWQHVPAHLGLRVVDGLAVYGEVPDVFRLASSWDVQPGDVFYQRLGDWAGTYWVVATVSAKFTWRASVQEVEVHRLTLAELGLTVMVGV